MKRPGVARRLLDPWAGLVLAALIVLAVVILLAVPGPWGTVVGPRSPVTLGSSPPSDLAVFVLAGSSSRRCSAVVWLHVEHDPAEATFVLVPPRVQAAVDGGGYAPLERLVTDVGPQAAGDALSDALGVRFDGWVVLEPPAVDKLLEAAGSSPGGRRRLVHDAVRSGALAAVAVDLVGLRRLHRALSTVLAGVGFHEINVNAIANYVLGSDDVETDLDLRAASALAQTLRALESDDATVRTAAAIVETCGGTGFWRLDGRRLEPLRLSLELGFAAPAAVPRVVFRRRAAEVLLVVPPDADRRASAAALRDALVRQGSRPVVVRAAAVSAGAAQRGLAALVARRRPLAVVLAPWGVGTADAPATADGASADETRVTPVPAAETAVAGQIEDAADALRAACQPAVLVGPPPGAPDELEEAAAATGLPVVDPSAGDEGSIAPGARVTAEDCVAAAVARACWPAYLGAGLWGTRLEFSYAARRATRVALRGGDLGRLPWWLAACGFEVVEEEAGSGWAAPPSPAIAYRTGSRRAALTLAGDCGWPPAVLVPDDSAPDQLVVVAGPVSGQ